MVERAVRLLQRMMRGIYRACMVLIAVTHVAACSGDFSKGDPVIKYNPEEDRTPVTPVAGLPQYGCIGAIEEFTHLREAAAIVPDGMRAKPKPQDSGWAPWELADLAIRGDRIVVTDRRAASFTMMTREFTERRTFERKGSGPGEMKTPSVVRLDMRADSIWILDRGHHKIMGFDVDGRFTRELPVSNDVVDFDVTADGRFFTVHQVIVANARGVTTLVSELVPDGMSKPILSFAIDELKPPEFALPGPNVARIKVLSNYVAVFFPAAGVVNIYDPQRAGLKKVSSIRTCVTPELAEFYERQRNSGVNRQSSLILIADVALRGDTVLVTSALQDNESRFGIQRFAIESGENLGAIAIASGPIALPHEVRFRDGSVSELITMDTQKGFIASMQITSAPRLK